MELRVRLAKQDDLILTFGFRNDPSTREYSFDQGLIQLEDHMKWFNRELSWPGKHLMIVEGYDDSKWVPIALWRVDGADVSMSLAVEWRGQHLATPVIKTGIAYVKDKFPTGALAAFIKGDNVRAVKAFAKAGFRYVGRGRVKGHECLVYICTTG